MDAGPSETMNSPRTVSTPAIADESIAGADHLPPNHPAPRNNSPGDHSPGDDASHPTASPPTFDPIWEAKIYSQGRMLNRYPYDIIVSFLFRHLPRDRSRDQIKVLEIGCGAGNNSLFAAQEGFAVAGIDGSSSAIAFAEQRFTELGLRGDLRVGDFTNLPFDDNSFDLAFERGALVCTGFTSARRAISEVRRVLRPGGKFFLNPYSDTHTSAHSGRPIGDGLVTDVQSGTIAGAGQLCFYSRADVDAAIAGGWTTLSLEHMESRQFCDSPATTHAEWRVALRKEAA